METRTIIIQGKNRLQLKEFVNEDRSCTAKIELQSEPTLDLEARGECVGAIAERCRF